MRKSYFSARSAVFHCLTLLWCVVGMEFVNLLGPEGAGYNVLYASLAGTVLWALMESFVPRTANACRRFLFLAAAPFALLLHFSALPVYNAVTILFGLLAGAIFSAVFAHMSSRFTGKHRYTKISAAIGCHFCGVAVYFLLSEALFNSIYEGALASGTGDDAAYMLALENGGLIIHIVMAAIPLLLGVLYAPPERTEQEMGTPHVLVGLPANKGLLTAIGCGILVLSCVMDTQFKAYLTVSDYQDIDLFYVFIAARIARLPMVTLYGFLLDKKRWRLMVSIPLVMILLCGSIPLLFNGAAAAGIVFFLSVMGGHSFTYLLFILPVMLASRLKRPPLLNCLGPVIYLLITVFLDVTISRLNIGPVLFENKEFLFVAVVLCAAGMFFLLMEFFIRQRGLELQAEFAASLQSNIPSPNADTSTPRLPVTSGLPNVAEIAKTYMLTKREAELFPYLLSPLTAEDISRETYIAVSTTRTHISNILSKLQVPSRRELQKAFGQDVSQDVFSM